MSRPLSHPDYEQLLGAYALDAVDGAEAAAVDLHLLECPRCRAEVALHRETAGLLAHAGASAPDGLWNRISGQLREAPPALASVKASKVGHGRADALGYSVPAPYGTGPGTTRFSAPGSPPTSSAPPSLPRGGRGVSTATRWRRRISVRPVAALAGVAALVIGILGFEISNLQTRVSQVQKSESTGGLQQLAAVALGTPGHETVTLRSHANEELATAVIVPNGQGYLIDVKLPHLAPSQTYQLWGLTHGKTISLSLLGDTPGQASFHLDFAQVTELMITVEPVGGVQRPDKPAVVTGAPVPD